MASDQASIAQRSLQKFRFDHKDMDYYFSWILGRQFYDGSDPDECYAAADSIADGDASSWQIAWEALAETVSAQAQTALSKGDREGARLAYLSACTYYRAPLFIMSPENPAFRENWRMMHGCFQQAAPLFETPIEAVQVPYRGRLLPGYFWKVDGSGQPRPTLIVSGGLETFAEDCYFMVASSGPEWGYNVLAVDLPGQGLNPDQGLPFTARMGPSVEAVVDYALARPEIDPGRLALYGFSWGGHIAFKGAQQDHRLKAMIANPAMPDVFRAVLAQQAGHNRGDPLGRIVFDQIAWRMGLRIRFNPGDILRRFGAAYDYLFYGKVDPVQIEIPVFCIAGEGEAPITLKIARETFEKLPNPQKMLAIFTAAEGGAAHCQVDNPALPNAEIFEWLDEVFG
jgi:pimeloyl-ACP methyl ester carboxylesterase